MITEFYHLFWLRVWRECLEIHVKGEYKKCKWILFSRGHMCCHFSFGANLRKKAFHWQKLYGFSIVRNVCRLVPEESYVLFSAWPYQTSSEPRAGGNKQPWPPSSQGFKAERGSDHDAHGTQIHEYLQVFSFSLFWKTEEQGAVGTLSHTPWLKNGGKGSLVEQHLRQILCLLSHNCSIRVPQCFCLLSNSSGWYGEGRSPGFPLRLALFQKAIFPAYVCWSDIPVTEYF